MGHALLEEQPFWSPGEGGWVEAKLDEVVRVTFTMDRGWDESVEASRMAGAATQTSSASSRLDESGPSAGKIAVVSEIIDHNRAIIDGPTTDVPRQSYPYKHLTLTPLKIVGLPRGAGSGPLKKQLEKQAVVEKWNKSGWAQKLAAVEKRRSLNDFDRFKVMLAKKQRRDVVRKALGKSKA
ncbi:hypothetical protein NLJ89_g6583 [Agrocybe chaxingu]|uniref:Large ribosomal subunit protein eL14 domain-containing protein n=1 Tax=Agrocybe chaxingu TaxID=84603 RepID=A0A9W8JYY9_9AGAR|nr:hypothetical protein NLJ89_g6583 [Agrocybe chaxingu]